MIRTFHVRKSSILAILFVAWLTPVARAQTDLSKFPLSKALPSDCFIAVAARGNPERAFLHVYWKQVHDALMDSGILSDVWDMILENVEDDKLQVIEDVQSRFSKLCAEVDWDDLFSKEHIFAGRFVSPVPQAFTFENVIMGRMNKESALKNYGKLKAILDEIVKLVEAQGGQGMLSVSETKNEGYIVSTLSLGIAPNLGLSVAACNDVIAISFGTTSLLDESIGLLRGKTEKKGLIASDRFKKALSTLPPAEDKFVFFDYSNMMSKMGNFFTKMGGGNGKRMHKESASPRPRAKHAKPSDHEEKDADEPENEKGEKDESDQDEAAQEEFNPLPMMTRIIGDMSFIDCIAEVEWTDGHRVYSESVTMLLPHSEENPLTSAFAGVAPVKDFARFIPKDATTFSCSNGVNWGKLYDYLRQLAKEEIPGGDKFLKQFDHLQKEEWGIDIKHDVLEVYNGPITSVQSGNDWVLMIGVSDSDKARDQIKRLLEVINERLGQNKLILSSVDVGGKSKFSQVTHPMMMMMGGFAPVIGVAEDNLILGSSAKAVGKIIKTAHGELPNITKSKQWQEEALSPKSGNLDSISFTDERRFGEELQQSLGAISMGLGVATMMVQSQDVPPPIQNLCKAVPPILAKLGPVAGKLNFYQSSSKYTVFEDHQWRTREVQNYKDPAEVAAAAESGNTEKKQIESERATEQKHRKHKAPDKDDDEKKSEKDKDGDE